MGRFTQIFLRSKSCYFVTKWLKLNTGVALHGNKPLLPLYIIVTFNIIN